MKLLADEDGCWVACQVDETGKYGAYRTKSMMPKDKQVIYIRLLLIPEYHYFVYSDRKELYVSMAPHMTRSNTYGPYKDCTRSHIDKANKLMIKYLMKVK